MFSTKDWKSPVFLWLLSTAENIQVDRKNNDKAGDNDLPLLRYGQDAQAVCECADNKGTDDGAQYRAFSTA